jgi:hypothetical protein
VTVALTAFGVSTSEDVVGYVDLMTARRSVRFAKTTLSSGTALIPLSFVSIRDLQWVRECSCSGTPVPDGLGAHTMTLGLVHALMRSTRLPVTRRVPTSR